MMMRRIASSARRPWNLFSSLALAFSACALNFFMAYKFLQSSSFHASSVTQVSVVCALVAMPSRSTESELRHFQRRLFQEYLQEPSSHPAKIRLRFFVGITEDKEGMEQLLDEQRQFGDLEILEIRESYENLTVISFLIFEKSMPLICDCDAGFLIKADTDVLVGYRNLAQVLTQLPSTSTYFGLLIPNMPVGLSSRYSTDHAHSFFPLFANGAFYGLSADAVELLTDPRVCRTVLKPAENYIFREEDRSLGLALARSGSTIENLVFTKSAYQLCSSESYTCEDYGHAIAFGAGVGLSGSTESNMQRKLETLEWLRQRHSTCNQGPFQVMDHLSVVDSQFFQSEALQYLFYGCRSLNDNAKTLRIHVAKQQSEVQIEMATRDSIYATCAETLYRKDNSWVDDLIRDAGAYPSGKAHYLDKGWKVDSMHYFCPEGCYEDVDSCAVCDKETIYLKTYPDVQAHVSNGTLSSGLDHFQRHGADEGRSYSCFEQYQNPGNGDGPGCLELYNSFVEATRDTVSTWPIHGEGTTELKANTCKTVLIVGGRDHPRMDYVLRVHRRYTGPDWSFVLVGPKETTDIWRKRYAGPMVSIIDLPAQFGDLSISTDQYNDLLRSKFLWEDTIQCEHVLVSQTDAILLRHGIEDFFEYSYVGSPVYPESFPPLEWRYLCAANSTSCGGNGGLSLRRKSSMLRALNDCQSTISTKEDVWFSACMMELNEHLPTSAIANRFSTGSKCKIDAPFGIDKIWQSCRTSSCALALLMSRLAYDTFGDFEPTEMCEEGEQAYLSMYPDVKKAVRSSGLSSGWHHFQHAGKQEGRVYRCLKWQ